MITPSEKAVTIRNKSLFTNTSDYTCEWVLEKEGQTVAKGVLETKVEPLATATYELKLPETLAIGEYVLTVSLRLKASTLWASSGHEVAYGQAVYQIGTQEVPVATKPVTVIQGDFNIGVRGEHFHIIFSKKMGALASMKYAGVEYLKQPLYPNFWRAMTDNDRGCGMQYLVAQWKLASLYPRLVDVKVEQDKTYAELVATYALTTTPAATCTLTYKIDGDGCIKVTKIGRASCRERVYALV